MPKLNACKLSAASTMAFFAGITISQPASAGPFDCSFDTDTCGFTQFADSPAPSTSLVNGGRLEMHTDGVIYNIGPGTPPGLMYPTASEIYIHQTLDLSYTQPWETSIWVEIPNNLEPNLPYGHVNLDEIHFQVGIAVIYRRPDNSFYTYTTSLLSNSDLSEKQRQYDADSKFNPAIGNQAVFADVDVPTLDENGTVGIRFDPSTKTLTGFNAVQDILSVDIDDPVSGWGMTDSDIFNVAILLEARGLPVPNTAPLAVDDFVVNQVPLPTSLPLLAGAATMLMVAGRKHARLKKILQN